MATTYNFKTIHDVPEWFPVATAPNNGAAGVSITEDLREGIDRHPYIYQFASAAILNAYNPVSDEWLFLGSPGMGTFGAGCNSVFVPSAGPNGTLAAGWNTTQGGLTTALPAAVAPNQLGNRGDGIKGFKIRIIGNAGAGSSGKTEERYIVANTGGTTPTITLDSALSFSPASGDRYEILSGRLFMMATATPMWRYYDVATNSFSGNQSEVNLTAPAVDCTLVALDELYTPCGKLPGQGFFGSCTATASTNVTNATLTGTNGAADASLQANEYANFQVRIIEDTGTPAAVGQRKKITSHTGANPTVYTLSGTWGTAPSATCKYVIEGIGDVIAFTGSAVALSHSYAAGGFRADGAWSTGVTNGASAALQIPARQVNTAAGQCGWWAFGLAALDAQKAARYSALYFLRGGAVATMDCLDLATLSWSTGVGGANIAYGNKAATFTTGTSAAYDPNGNGGEYTYIQQSALQRFLRFDNKNRVLEPWNYYRQAMSTAVIGSRMAMAWAVDGTTYGSYVYMLSTSQANFSRALAPY